MYRHHDSYNQSNLPHARRTALVLNEILNIPPHGLSDRLADRLVGSSCLIADHADWELQPAPGPQQRNGFDCGVHTLERVACILERAAQHGADNARIDEDLPHPTPEEITALRGLILALATRSRTSRTQGAA